MRRHVLLILGSLVLGCSIAHGQDEGDVQVGGTFAQDACSSCPRHPAPRDRISELHCSLVSASRRYRGHDVNSPDCVAADVPSGHAKFAVYPGREKRRDRLHPEC